MGVGEATLSPSAYSMIAGHFPKQRLALAIGVFSAGITAGVGAAFLAGAAVIQWVASLGTVGLPGLPPLSGWRLVFVIVGALGMPVALLMLFVREPARPASSAIPATVREVISQFRANWRSYAFVMSGYGAASITIYSVLTWTPTFYQRHFGATILSSHFARPHRTDRWPQRRIRGRRNLGSHGARRQSACEAEGAGRVLRGPAGAGRGRTNDAKPLERGGGAFTDLFFRFCGHGARGRIHPVDHARPDARSSVRSTNSPLLAGATLQALLTALFRLRVPGRRSDRPIALGGGPDQQHARAVPPDSRCARRWTALSQCAHHPS